MWGYIWNSVLVAAVAVPVTVVVGSLAGFAIATAGPVVRRRLVLVSLVALMIPVTALWIPRFVLFRWAGLIDTPIVLMLPALMATTPFFVLIFAVVYSRIPKQMFEAAALEGSSAIATWRRVAVPLGRPATFAVAVLALVWHWANFVDPLLYLTTEERFTVPLALRTLQTLEATNHPLMLAAAVIATVIPLALFFLAQRAFFVKTLDI
jgi:multiple sugar transport system permease protein